MDNALVSIIIISYNSSATILETLDSIYAQTYSNLELIVSDDCSSDGTVSIAQQWAQAHRERFVNCIIHTNPQNLGVPENLNAGIRLSKGHFIKILAADDLLLPHCIEANVSCCQEHQYDNLFSRAQTFCIRDGQKVRCNDIVMDTAFFLKPAHEQYVDMLIEHRVISPTVFITRALLDEMGLYDPRYRFMEDYPMNLRLPKAGHQIHFMDKYTVEYRLSESSLSNTTSGRVVHPGFQKNAKSFFYRERFCQLLRHKKIKRAVSEMRKFLCNDLILLFGNDSSRKIVRFLLKLRDSHLTNQ